MRHWPQPHKETFCFFEEKLCKYPSIAIHWPRSVCCVSTVVAKELTNNSGSQTSDPRGRFVRTAKLFRNFQIINIYLAKCLEKRCSQIIESKLIDAQWGFHSSHSTTDHIFALHLIFVKSWECGKDVYICTCFVDLFEKACDRVTREKPWGSAFKSLQSCSEVCVRVGRVKSQPFTVGVGLRQGCMLSPLHLIILCCVRPSQNENQH